MASYQITINAPEGKIPVYNESTQSIDFVDSDIRERVKTYEDALKVLEKKDHPMLMTCPNI